MPSPEGVLYLLPNLLDEEVTAEYFLPASVSVAVHKLQGLIPESEKSARRFLRRFVSREALDGIAIRLLNEHTPPTEIDELLAPIAQGQTWGLISDAGLPCLADPGAPLVFRARMKGLRIETFVGPSSLILALQLSGLGGQRFAFHGYLPRETDDLRKALQKLETRSREEDATQIWIEAPYRSAKMLAACLEHLQPSTLFSVALSLTTPQERVLTQKISAWRKGPFSCEKEPAVFLVH